MAAATTDKNTVDTTVDDVSNALANTTISKTDDKSAADAAASASAAEGRRLYIGNLAYASTEENLKEFFKGYLIESVSIPKNPRTEKAVGYAFVDLSTPTEATQAIEELSGKEILERKVSVQLAHKPEPAGEKTEATNGDASAEGSRRRGSGRGRGRARGRAGRGARGGRTGAEGGKDEVAPETAAATDAAPAATEVLPLTDITNKSPTDKDGKTTKAPRPPREKRERGPPENGIASKTKVMVANLPYDLTEEKLKELFSAYQPSSAKIALRPIPRFMIKKLQARGEPRKGRGFGFVTLASEEMQQKAVNEMNAQMVEGREIAVKVAIDSPDKTDDDHVDDEVAKEEAKEEAKANGSDAAPVHASTEAADKATAVA